MTNTDSKKAAPPAAPSGTDRASESPMIMMGRLISGSLGRIPAGLVIITVIALTMALVSGAALQYAKEEVAAIDPLAPRLKVGDGQPVDAKFLEGEWIAKTGAFAMSWQAVGDNFEWSIRHRDEPLIVYFCRGKWKMVGDVMVLSQKSDLGYPSDPDKPNVRYMPIPMKDIQFYVRTNGVNTKWEIPDSEYSRVTGGLFRFFNRGAVTVLDWSRR